ncbi:hypothetical protein BCR33DRAFT_714574 [Rhizoclosmatium globosum]|uniref:N-acetyltransferase domain-containing protein n=1 Tax=Rhizoclosmatium globosum TaxID=329046 RepID=A0A1Y2CPA8_9FUNG|nr:hypothetical protein BCR33DRAFT_714574 [Rhizoclosmatium globosum]|eukprot:ORY48155.1 hypothetical protein BCR33DRAFT_714574 [Rhizoclosmatium globosum]
MVTDHIIRSVTTSDEDTAIQVLVTAFRNEPIASFITPDEPAREARLLSRFQDMIKNRETNNMIVDITDTLNAAAIWEYKSVEEPKEPEVEVEHAAAKEEPPSGLSAAAEEMRIKLFAAEPPRPFFYLAYIGTTTKGQGAGSALIRHQLNKLPKGEKTVLFTSDGVEFYERFGFKVSTKVEVDGFSIYWMIRE